MQVQTNDEGFVHGFVQIKRVTGNWVFFAVGLHRLP